MHEISKYIKDLIIKNDTIILPGIGAFYTQYKEAQLAEDGKKMSPAYKKLFFNPNLKQDDGMLIQFICEKEECNKVTAEKLLKAYTNQLKTELAKGKVELSDLGSFSQDSKGKINFQAKADTEILLDNFGFEQIELPPTLKQEKAKTKSSPKPTHSKPKRSLAWLYISIPVVIVGGGLFALIQLNYISVDQITKLFSSPPIEMPGEHKAQEIPKAQVKETIEDTNDDVSNTELEEGNTDTEDINEEANSTIEIQDEEIKAENKVQEFIDTQTQKKNALRYEEKPVEVKVNTYYLIAGSFQSKENAMGLLNKLRNQGYDSELLQGNNIWRVTFGSYTNKTMANNEMKKIRQENSKASVWLLTL